MRMKKRNRLGKHALSFIAQVQKDILQARRDGRGEYADGLERYVADIESGKTKVRPKSRSRFALT